MKKDSEMIIVIGLLIGWTLLLSGCTNQTNDNTQTSITQPELQDPGQDQTNQGRPLGMRGNMSAAFAEACSGKNAGDVCLITFRNNTMNGTCEDRQGNITCQTNNMPPGGFGGNRTMGNRTGGPRPGNYTGPRNGNYSRGGMPTELPPGIDEVPN